LLHLSREIGFAQQALVAHPTDGLEGCDRLRTSATAFSALSKHNSVIKTFLVLFDIADFPISHRSLKAIMPLNAPESRPQSFDNPDWGVGAPSSLKRTSGSYWRSYRRFIELTPFRAALTRCVLPQPCPVRCSGQRSRRAIPVKTGDQRRGVADRLAPAAHNQPRHLCFG
jgi:hypothetical protein